jgi:hypothetical protein
MKITLISHLDHGLHESVFAHVAERFAARSAFFIETFELPTELPSVPCGLHGPVMGDAPVGDAEVTLKARGNRAGPSRLCARAPREVRTVTVIAGPHDCWEDDPCVLYTAFGGPLAPREPWDESLTPEQRAESEAFWATHALSKEQP